MTTLVKIKWLLDQPGLPEWARLFIQNHTGPWIPLMEKVLDHLIAQELKK